MKGIELAARFSYITNSLRFCGPKKASKQFLQYLSKKNNEQKVKDSLLKFEGLYPYLSAIAEKNNKDIFDYEVIEAYWIGNKLLDNFTNEDNKTIIKKLMQRGLPKSIGENLINNLPSGLLPHHNFNVMYVGVGRVTGSVETNLQNMDNCRISWGKVLEVLQDKLLVQSNLLIKNKNKFELKQNETKTAVYLKQMLPDAMKNDIVALHWGFAPLILTKEQGGNLDKYTNTILAILNKN